jgi:hypothetical protein
VFGPDLVLNLPKKHSELEIRLSTAITTAPMAMHNEIGSIYFGAMLF